MTRGAVEALNDVEDTIRIECSLTFMQCSSFSSPFGDKSQEIEEASTRVTTLRIVYDCFNWISFIQFNLLGNDKAITQSVCQNGEPRGDAGSPQAVWIVRNTVVQSI